MTDILNSGYQPIYLTMILYLLSFIYISYNSEVLKLSDKHPYLKMWSYIGILGILVILGTYIRYDMTYRSVSVQDSPYVIFAFIILITQFAHTVITDPKIHRVDKWLNRLGYLSSSLLVIIFLIKKDIVETNILLITLLVGLVVLGILFFVFTSIGAADFRLLAIGLPLVIMFYRLNFSIPLLLSLLFAGLYQFTIQKKAGNNRLPVPIGHIIILTFLVTIVVKFLIDMNV